MATGLENLTLVHAGEPLPRGASLFLAGPTPRSADVPSWRPAAIRQLAVQWQSPGKLAILIPEPRGGQRFADYDDQVQWETDARAAATAILFWIPRDLATLPGFTTNVEFGLDVTTGRAVLGCPPDCPDPERNRYLIWVARRHGVDVCDTLEGTVAAALGIASRRLDHAGTGSAIPPLTSASSEIVPPESQARSPSRRPGLSR